MTDSIFEPLTVFEYVDGILSTGGVSVSDLAETYGTPLYVYNVDDILQRYHRFTKAFTQAKQAVGFTAQHMVHFAVKSNSNQAILTALGTSGSGMDIVSGGELKRVLKAGITANKVIFSGVAKSDWELAYALEQGVLQINVESVEEIHQLQAVASSLDIVAPVALRVNPNVDACTHDKINTGKKTEKFGVDISVAPQVYADMMHMSHISPQGISVHIGSQLMSAEPFVQSYQKVADLAQQLMADGIPLCRLDLGGGLGICYEPNGETPPDIHQYARMVMETVGHLNLDIHFEPGRWLVGQSGALIGRVENIKTNDVKTFVLTDMGMNDLIRPTLYEAYHHVVPVHQTTDTICADVVGPVCESGDYICKNRHIGTVQRGDYMAVLSAGAYGMVQACTYNARPTPAEVAVYQGTPHLIRSRQTVDDIINMDSVPETFKA